MKKILFTFIITFCVSLAASAQVQWDLSLNYYFETEETAYLSPPDLYTGLSSAVGIRGKVMFPWGNYFVGGVLFSHVPNVELLRFGDEGSGTELGLFVGPRFEVGEVELIGTGEITYRIIGSDSESVEGEALGLNLNITAAFLSQNRISPKVEIGFISQPSGGNEDHEFTFSPYWYIGGGIIIR